MRGAWDVSTPVTVLGAVAHGPLGIVRSLGRLGVPVSVVAADPRAPALASRYCRAGYVCDLAGPAAGAVRALREVGRAIGRRSILIPTSDEGAVFTTTHAAALREVFTLVDLDASLIRALCDKRTMHLLATRMGVPTAYTVFPRGRDDVVEFLEHATFPAVLKGIDGVRLQQQRGRRMFVVRERADLLRAYQALEDPTAPNLMLQEYIPGGTGATWMFNGYFDAGSRCVVGFTGQKLRQHPIHGGSTSLGICRRNDAVAALTRRFMSAIAYRGPVDIDYCHDARDGRYKVLDVNPRIGATFRLFVRGDGVDVARALYLDLTGQPVPPGPIHDGRRWLVEDLDLVSSLQTWRRGGPGLREWARSLRGVEEAAYLARDDLRPLLRMCGVDVRKLLARRPGRWQPGAEATPRAAWCPPIPDDRGERGRQKDAGAPRPDGTGPALSGRGTRVALPLRKRTAAE
jgi:predicted ATP-grasp superfamily ATP-dependent carboligase